MAARVPSVAEMMAPYRADHRERVVAEGPAALAQAVDAIGKVEQKLNFPPQVRGQFIGKAAEVIPDIETALRLSPRDPLRNFWELFICHAHAHQLRLAGRP